MIDTQEIDAIEAKLKNKIPQCSDLCNAARAGVYSIPELQEKLFSLLPGVTPVAKPSLDFSQSERSVGGYSIARAILSAAEHGGRPDGYEAEVSRELSRMAGRKTSGFFVPRRELGLMNRADILAGGATLAGAMVPTVHMGGDFIEMLRNAPKVVQLGARVITGITGNIVIPRQTDASTVYWTTETQATTQSDLGFNQTTLSPKAVTGFVKFSRQAMISTVPAIDALIKSDLAQVMSIGIDRAICSTVAGAPSPITAFTGANLVTLAANGCQPTFEHLVSLESSLTSSNADGQAMAYLTHPAIKGRLKQTPESTSVATPGFVWHKGPNGYDVANGIRAEASCNVPNNWTCGTTTATTSPIFLGNWTDLLIAEFSPVEIIVDQYTEAANRLIRVFSTQYVDWAPRHGASFAVGLGALP